MTRRLPTPYRNLSKAVIFHLTLYYLSITQGLLAKYLLQANTKGFYYET